MPGAVGRSRVFDSCCLDLQRPFLALTATTFIRRGRTRDRQGTLDSNSSFRLVCFNHSGRHAVPPDPGVALAVPRTGARPHRRPQYSPLRPSPTCDPMPSCSRSPEERSTSQVGESPQAHGASPRDANIAASCVFGRMLHRSRNARLSNLPSTTACEDCPSEDRRAHGDLLPPPGDADVEHCDPSESAKAPCRLRRRCAIES